MVRQPDTEYILSLSYGKDSIACLEAIKQLGYPLDRIIHAEVWATDTIPADLPPMVEFKKYADNVIKERYGIVVEHTCATRGGAVLSYERQFYHTRKSKSGERIYGFPYTIGAWCNSRLKVGVLTAIAKGNIRKEVLPNSKKEEENTICGNANGISDCERKLVYGVKNKGDKPKFSETATAQGGKKNIVQYLGIASDEPTRIARHSNKPNIILPLVDIGWDESFCRKWCEDNKLLSPIYTTATRGGCWFCHNQGVEQLRLLYKNYPDLWELLLKWDLDSPTTFKSDGHTVHDYDKRFKAEGNGLIKGKFRWKQVLGDDESR